MKKLNLIASITLIAILSITVNAFCMKRKRDDLGKIQANYEEQRQTSKAPPSAAAQSDDQHPSKRQKKGEDFIYPKYKRIQHNDTTIRLFHAIEQADYSTVEEILNDNPKIVFLKIKQTPPEDETITDDNPKIAPSRIGDLPSNLPIKGEDLPRDDFPKFNYDPRTLPYASPLHKAITSYICDKPDKEKKRRLCSIIRLILEKGANPNERATETLDSFTPLDRLLPEKDCNELINLLISKGANQYSSDSLHSLFNSAIENAQILLENNLLLDHWLHTSINALDRYFFSNKFDSDDDIMYKKKLISFMLKALKTNRYNHLKNTTLYKGLTPLHLAIRNLTRSELELNRIHLDLIEQLITEENINQDTKDNYELRPFIQGKAMFYYSLTPASLVFRSIHFKQNLLQLLVSRGAQFRPTQKNKYLLHAAQSPNVNAIDYLIKNGCNVNQKDHAGNTPLHILLYQLQIGGCYVSLANFTQTAKLLIKGGCDVNQINNKGNNPLHVLSRSLAYALDLEGMDLEDGKEIVQIAKLLIVSGCNVNQRNSKGNTPLITLLKPFSTSDTADTGEKAQLFGENLAEAMEVAKLFVKNGALINITDNKGNSPLSLALKIENLPLIELLLKNGADIRHPKITIADIFYDYRQPLYQLLARNGAKLGINLDNLKEQRTQIIKKWEHELDIAKTPIEEYVSQAFNTTQIIDQKIEDGIIDIDNIDKLRKKRDQVVKGLYYKLRKKEMLTPEYLQKRNTQVRQRVREIDQRIEYEAALLAQFPHLHTLYSNYSHALESTFKLSQIVRQILSESYLNAPKIKRYSSEIQEALTTLFQLVHSDQVITHTKLQILDVIAKLDLQVLQAINTKLKLNLRFNWNNLLCQIPFNLSLLNSRYLRYLRKIAFKNQTKDMNGETFLQAQCKYPVDMYYVLLHEWPLFFSYGEMKPLTENLLRGKLTKKEAEKNPFTKEIAKRVMPLTVRDNKSYRHNPYHKAFMHFCSMFSMLQTIKYKITTKDYHTGELSPATLILEKGIIANIMKYIHPKDLFDGKSYVPSRNYYEFPSTFPSTPAPKPKRKQRRKGRGGGRKPVRGRRRQTVAPPAAAESEYDDDVDVEFLDN